MLQDRTGKIQFVCVAIHIKWVKIALSKGRSNIKLITIPLDVLICYFILSST